MDIVIHNYLTGFALFFGLIAAIAAPAAALHLWQVVLKHRRAEAFAREARALARAEYLRVMRHPRATSHDKLVVSLTWEAWCLLEDPIPDDVRAYVLKRM